MKVKLTATSLPHPNRDDGFLSKLGFDLQARNQAREDEDWERYKEMEYIEKEVKSLDELKELLIKCEQSVIHVVDDYLYIEIYNDYRE
jgi:hypothetical protein